MEKKSLASLLNKIIFHDTTKVGIAEQALFVKKGAWGLLPSLKKRSRDVNRIGIPHFAENHDLCIHSGPLPTAPEPE